MNDHPDLQSELLSYCSREDRRVKYPNLTRQRTMTKRMVPIQLLERAIDQLDLLESRVEALEAELALLRADRGG